MEIERHLVAQSQVALDKNCGDEEFKVIGNGPEMPQKNINTLFASMAGTPSGQPKRDRVNSDGFCDLENDEHLAESKQSSHVFPR